MVLELRQSKAHNKNRINGSITDDSTKNSSTTNSSITNSSSTDIESADTQLVPVKTGQASAADSQTNHRTGSLWNQAKAKFPAHADKNTPASRDNAMLMLRRDDDVNQCWPLSRDETFVIGRDDTCDMVLADRQVSRNHAIIRWNGELYTIEDLGSTNGTHVNGNATTVATPLIDGDEFQIGFKFRVSFVDDGATVPLHVEPISTGLSIEMGNRTVRIGNEVLDPPLSPPQFRLLQLLWDAESAIVSRNQIADSIWPEDSIDGISEQAIDALVRRLRERIAKIDPDNTYIATIRGHGFRLNNRSTD